MADIFCQIMITVFGLPAIYLLARDNRWGWVLGLSAQPFWFLTAYLNGQWGIFILSVAYAFNWCYGIYRHFWMPKKKEAKNELV